METQANGNSLYQTFDELVLDDQRYYMHTFGKRYGIALVRGEGVYVYDSEDRRYLDMLAGIAVSGLGHGNPRLVDAISHQAAQLIHCSNLYYNPQQTALAKQLCQLTGMERCFFANSGAEANEAAIKLARAYFYKQGKEKTVIVSAAHSFHGRTLATVTATGQEKYSAPFAPLPPNFRHTAFNDAVDLEKAVTEDTAAVLLELVQGESGVHPLDRGYAHLAARLCAERGALLIIDEVQSGMGRCGAFTACQAYDIQPDIITLAKGLAGGVPIGACLATEAVADAFAPGDHGTTFGGGPLASAAALAVLAEYDRLDLISASRTRGEQLKSGIERVFREKQLAVEVRGLGLMLGFESPLIDAALLRVKLQDAGVLVNSIGAHTIRLLPPLTLSEADINYFLERLAFVLAKHPSEKSIDL